MEFSKPFFNTVPSDRQTRDYVLWIHKYHTSPEDPINRRYDSCSSSFLADLSSRDMLYYKSLFWDPLGWPMACYH